MSEQSETRVLRQDNQEPVLKVEPYQVASVSTIDPHIKRLLDGKRKVMAAVDAQQQFDKLNPDSSE